MLKDKRAEALVWGQVKDDKGNVVTARLICPEGYTLTALTALETVEQVLKGNVKTGFQTPSLAYGPDFILSVNDNVVREDLQVVRQVAVD